MAHLLSSDEREAFLAEARVAVLGVEAPGRAPLGVPIWYAYAPGGELGLWMDGASHKARCLRRAGRLTLVVQDTTRPYRYVSVEGPVTRIDPIDWHAELVPLVTRYLGANDAPAYLAALGGPTGVVGDVYVRAVPARWRAEQL
jgi:nitroimidazol reductase NimA-like FMN-containing flavoprotein (pyridoxamine 5'-phosphate oxidase superfamily)